MNKTEARNFRFVFWTIRHPRFSQFIAIAA